MKRGVQKDVGRRETWGTHSREGWREGGKEVRRRREEGEKGGVSPK